MLVGGRNKFGSTENEVISAHVPVCISNQVLGPHPWPYPLTIPALVLTTLARYSPVPRYIIWIFYSTDISMEALPHIKGDECMLSLGIEDSVMVVLESIQRPSPRVTGDRGF